MHQCCHDRPDDMVMFMFSARRLFDTPENLPAPLDRLNRDPQLCQLPVRVLVLWRQGVLFGCLAGRETVGIELEQSLVARISVCLQSLQDAQPTLVQEGEIMGPPCAPPQEHLQRLHPDDPLGCERLPLLFARIILTLARDWSCNRLLGHVAQNGLQSLRQQGFLAWQPQVLPPPPTLTVRALLGRRFAAAKPGTQVIKGALLPHRDQGQQPFLFQGQDT
jgi:hypothetical protein